MTALFLMGAALVAAALAWGTHWLALIPWRRSAGQHWTERARLYHPVRVAAAGNLLIIPGVLALLRVLLLGDPAPHWALIFLFALVGTAVGTIPMDREVFPRIPLAHLFRQAALTWMLRFMIWGVFLGAIALMPDEFNLHAFIIGASICALAVLWDLVGWLHVGRGMGLLHPADERLQRVVRETAQRMEVRGPEVWVLRISLAQAFAMPGRNRLLFSERLLQILTDDEVAAVCAHELAHLTEGRRDHLQRYVRWLIFLPWVFVRPSVALLGVVGMFPLTLCSLVAIAVLRRTSVRLERRADELAIPNEKDIGTYAITLRKLYEDGLIPAVTSKQHATHPDLYDRLLAAGVVVDFPRPKAAKAMAWNGHLFAIALGILAVLEVIRLTDFF